MHDEPTRRSPHETIPNTYRGVPHDRPRAGFTVGGATMAELRAAGFHGGPDAERHERKPGTAPLEEYLVEGRMASTRRTSRSPARPVTSARAAGDARRAPADRTPAHALGGLEVAADVGDAASERSTEPFGM
jgi:hypothetical protein